MKVAIDTLEASGCTQDDLHRIFHIRKQVFVDRLNWKVESIDDREFDDFDTPSACYIVVRQGDDIVATCRLIQTTNPTMLSDVFPDLLRGEDLIPDPKVCEISRLSSIGSSAMKRGALPHILQGLRNHADARGITEYVFVTTTTIERLLRRFGVATSRFGDRQTTTIDSVNSVALRLDVASIPRIH